MFHYFCTRSAQGSGHDFFSSHSFTILESMYIGLDIGGTTIRLGGSKSLDNPHFVGQVSLSNLPSYDQNLAQIITAIKTIGSEIRGIGVGIAAEVNDQKTTVISSTHLAQWHNKPFAGDLSRVFACPTTLIHDQACAALGEATYGKNVPDDFFLVGYGTGLGGAIVSRQGDKPVVQVIQGTVDYELFRDWEKACGGKSIGLEFGKPASDLSDTQWQIVMDRFYDHLLLFIHQQKPANMIFGGGVAVKQSTRLKKVFSRLQHEQPTLQSMRFSITSLGEDTALYGACALLRNTFLQI